MRTRAFILGLKINSIFAKSIPYSFMAGIWLGFKYYAETTERKIIEANNNTNRLEAWQKKIEDSRFKPDGGK